MCVFRWRLRGGSTKSIVSRWRLRRSLIVARLALLSVENNLHRRCAACAGAVRFQFRVFIRTDTHSHTASHHHQRRRRRRRQHLEHKHRQPIACNFVVANVFRFACKRTDRDRLQRYSRTLCARPETDGQQSSKTH